MASTCSRYKSGLLLGTGSCADGSTSITSYSGTAPANQRRVQVKITQAGTHLSRVYQTRVISGSGTATLGMRYPCPFVGA